MGTLYLVRHGQASFGADDYDVLSELGHRQCRRLGEYLQARGQRFDAVLRGTLRRHAESLQGIADGFGGALPEAGLWPGLNEYDAHAVVQAIHPGPIPKATTPEAVRAHFRLLREGLAAWTEGRSAPTGMPAYAEFAAGIAEVLDHVRSRHDGAVLMVTSGGPIGSALAQVLGAPPATAVELNLRIRNSAVTELTFTPKRYALHGFNHLPHLDAPEYAAWVTYS
jgi:broad specificity phosphatase PhoE